MTVTAASSDGLNIDVSDNRKMSRSSLPNALPALYRAGSVPAFARARVRARDHLAVAGGGKHPERVERVGHQPAGMDVGRDNGLAVELAYADRSPVLVAIKPPPAPRPGSTRKGRARRAGRRRRVAGAGGAQAPAGAASGIDASALWSTAAAGRSAGARAAASRRGASAIVTT